MTNEELVLLIQQGNPDHMGELWDQVKKFVYQKANKFYANGAKVIRCEVDDLTQAGFVALTEAVKSYNPERGTFINFYTFYLKTAFLTTAFGRTPRQQKDPLFFAADIDADLYEEGGVTLGEVIPGNAPDPEQCSIDSVYNAELRAVFDAVMDRALTPREKDVLQRHFVQGQTLKECAEVYGITVQATASTKDNALRKMRRNAKLSAFISERTPYFLGIGAARFNRDGYSPVEKLVEIRQQLTNMYNNGFTG